MVGIVTISRQHSQLFMSRVEAEVFLLKVQNPILPDTGKSRYFLGPATLTLQRLRYNIIWKVPLGC